MPSSETTLALLNVCADAQTPITAKCILPLPITMCTSLQCWEILPILVGSTQDIPIIDLPFVYFVIQCHVLKDTRMDTRQISPLFHVPGALR
mmetsp:Transcript_4952/g.8863  ORF Transcript_4952/g.8863 Transcript_4952/m.8863 type:complete len:92 (+) Transcript_4952:1745-2020(+)